MEQLQEVWRQVEGSVSTTQKVTALNLSFYLLLAALFALYIRWLYRTCSVTASNADTISRVFPLLALVTTAVIAVVKSSLALSLGLVGALSIVRFRAAIKDPEELVYLFLCIAIGLSLGAERPLLATTLVGMSTVFIVGMHFGGGRQRQQKLLLTITGDADQRFLEGEGSVVAALEEVAGRFTLQRFDVEQGRGQVRVVLEESSPQKTASIVTQLRKRLPECDMSYVNLNSTL